MSLCPYAYLELSLSSFLTASDKGSLTTIGELFNVSALDPLLPTLLIATLCLCVLLTIFYYSLVVAWEVFWASRQSPSPLDPSAEVVLTETGMWLVQPELTPHNARHTSVIHLDAVLHGIHLLPYFGDKFVSGDLHYSTMLDNFRYFYVNKHIDYHAFETVV